MLTPSLIEWWLSVNFWNFLLLWAMMIIVMDHFTHVKIIVTERENKDDSKTALTIHKPIDLSNC